MAWTHEILSVKVNDLSADYIIRFSNGTATRDIPFNISDPSSVKQIIINHINQFTKMDALSASLPIGIIDLTPPVVPGPTQDQIDRAAYSALAKKYKATQLAVAAKVVDASALTQIEADLKANYKTGYEIYIQGL